MTVTFCMRCGDSYCEPCGQCGACSSTGCACEPLASSALGFEGSCENCGRLVEVDEAILVYGDDVVVHVRCPPGRERAQA